MRSTELIVGPELAGTLMTPEEFDAIEEWEEGYRYELIHGVLVVTPPPLEGVRGPNDTLGHWLLTYREQHIDGAALDATLPEHTVRTRASRRRADRVIWAGLGRHPKRREKATIIAEFTSRGKRDRVRDYVEKRKEYLEISVQEYWVIDRFRRAMTVYRRKKPQKLVIEETEVYRTSLLPGFELPLADLLAVADRWDELEE